MDYFSFSKALPTCNHKRVATIEEADVAVVYGGDGITLGAIKSLLKSKKHNVPLISINTGHVGFLSNDVTEQEVIELLDKNDGAIISERFVLEVGNDYAFNEVAIQAANLGKLFQVNISLNHSKEELVYKGDGLVISTASGSTAYNMSAGGPIVYPTAKVMIFTPLAPFSLASRPVVFSEEVKEIIINTEDKAHIVIDGVHVKTNKVENLVVKMSSKKINLVKVNTFINSITHKLGWNSNIR